MTDAPASSRPMLGRYEILEEIAQGAMGVVYRARDPLIDRLVAIKTITLGLSDAETEAYERRFFREAKSAGRLNHPNVVTIFDVGKTDGVAYIAMEFLDGQSLREIIDSGVVLPPQRIADIAAEVAEGLAFAHDNGIVHRDVKPANIMVLASGAVKITDFGIALLPTGTRTVAGNAFGSPRYTSPEQVMGRPVDGRSDIFSLGATVYEMLTGASPFQGGDLNAILKQVLSDPTPPPSSHNPHLPRAFDHILGKMLAKDPADRYQTARALAEDLRRFDTLELDSAGPGPLPALEHPTTPFDLADLAASATPPDAPLAPPEAAFEPYAASSTSPGASFAPAAAPAAPSAAGPDVAIARSAPAGAWWKRRSLVAGAVGVLIVLAVAGIGLRRAPEGTSTAGAIPPPGSSARTAGAIGAPAAAEAGGAAQAMTSTPSATAAAAPVATSAATSSATAASAPAAPVATSAATPAAPGSMAVAPPAAATAAAGAATMTSPASAAAGAPTMAAAGPSTAQTGGSAAGPSSTGAATAPTGAAPSGGAAATPPAAASPAAPPKPLGRVSFAITPWGEIYIDGRRRGITPPLQELRLPPGKHVVEVRNATFPPYRETIELAANATLRIRHRFQ